MYQFVTGPLLWLSFAVFFIGLIARIVLYIRGLNWKLDRVTYRVNTRYGVKGALKSVFFWLLPFGARNWRVKPWFTLLFFAFHAGLVITPIFLLAHAVLLKERWGLGWPAISNQTADVLTVVVIVAAVFLVLRRLALPEVRIMTTAYDYLLIAVTVAPFITGFIAGFGGENYQTWLIVHVLTGEIWLVAVPFTKLAHVVLFFCSRVQLGMDFGIKRGGLKGRGLVW
ncbi:MAG: sulfate respiration complex protein HmcE [Thermodesulfobacteriota bacterium]